jgi:predicted DNA-binding transcriptional regulator AlpA
MQPQTLITDPLLTQEQAAQILGVAPGTLEVWRSTKRVPLAYIKLGKRAVRYRRSAIEAFLTAGTVAA